MPERTYCAYQMVAAELKADDPVCRSWLDEFFIATAKRHAIATGGTPLEEPRLVWHEITEAEEAMSAFEGHPSVRAGDWRVTLYMKCEVSDGSLRPL